MILSREQCRAARALLGWTQEQLEIATGEGGAKVAKKTIADFEVGKRTPYDRTLIDLRKALELAGVIFIDASEQSPDGGAGVRLATNAAAE